MDKLYIPGDLVKFATNTYTIVNFEENFLYNKICYGLISTNSTKTAFVADRDILPIPLTTEILEKNGWEFMGHQVDFGGFLFDIYSKRDILPYLYYYYATKDFSVSICGEVALPNMKYVHELQHLLFGLGINHEMEV